MNAKRVLVNVVAVATLVVTLPSSAQVVNCTVWETNSNLCPAACSDGLDNDGDGLTDAAAPGCKLELKGKVPIGHPSAGTLFDFCGDGVDNDGDGYIDRLDYGVGGSLGPDPNCAIETSWGAYDACTDGVNNDGDRYDNTAGGTTWTELIDRSAPVGATPDPECLGEVLCTDGVDNDGDGNADGNDTDCMCLSQATGLDNCTANDFTIAFTANPQEIADGCINTDDKVTLTSLLATLTAHSPDRYDLGLWIVLDGTSAYDGGRCLRQMLTPVKKTFLSGDPGYPSGPYNPPGPYPTLETLTPQNNTDQCGEVGNTQTARWEYPVPVTVPCSDFGVLASGFVELGQCGSWDNNQTNSYCGSITQAVPNNKAKCQCQTSDTNVPAPDLRTQCEEFTTPEWTAGAGPTLDPGETVEFKLSFTNDVTGCTPAELPITGDPFGRTRCGTVSFLRLVVDYDLTGVNADTLGDFYLADGITPIPSCASPASVPQTPLTGSGLLCNDTANGQLVWAPQDPVSGGAYGVVSAFSGTMTLPFRYHLDAAPPAGEVNMTATIFWDNDLDSDDDDQISAAEAVVVTAASKPQSCLDCGCATGFSTTPVTLTSFSAEREGGRVVFDWATATEVGNVAFNVLGLTKDGWTTLNREPIGGGAGDTLEPQAYQAVLAVPDDVTAFAIEDVDVKGRVRQHTAAELDPADAQPLDVEPIPTDAIRREHLAKAAGRRARLADSVGAAIRRAGASPAFGVQAAGAGKSTPAIELRVGRDGVYRVTYEALAAAGFDLANVATAKLGLTCRDAGVPIFVSAGKTFGPGSYFDFYGRALDTLYTTTNVYRLVVTASKPARAEVETAPPTGGAATAYMERRDFERNREYSFSSPTGDPWYDTRMLVYGAPNQWRFPFTVDGLVEGSGPARLAVHLFGGTDWPQTPDHHAVVILNGATLGDYTFDGLVDFPISIDLPAGLLREGANELIVRLPADLGVSADLVHLESWAVSYPRLFAAGGGTLTFTANGSRFDVTGLPAGPVAAYRVSGPVLTRLAGTVVTASGATASASVRGTPTDATYLVAAESTLLTPEIVAARPSTAITGGSARYLVIAHPDFLDSLAPLVAARQAQGLSVRVVDVEDVYAQFGHSIFDAAAIHAYVATAAATMGTEYVLLVGGDTYDYHDYLGIGSVSFIPSIYSATDDIVRFAPTDPAYADVDGDGTPDLAIGRLPVRTRAELDTAIAKTLAYQDKSYAATAVFAADRADAAANLPFAAASEKFVAALPAGWKVQRAYLDQLTVAEARTALLGAINGGVALTNYTGHSGPTAWTFKNLFSTADAASLLNAGRPTVVTQWGCWNTYYVNPSSESLATRLLLSGDRGAAAVLGATTLTEDIDENDLAALLAPRIAQPGTTLGQAILAAKQALGGDRAARADVLLGWTLLGDPALVVQP